jgi:hypothetical protein
VEWLNQFLDTTLAAYRITVVFLNLHRNHVLYTLFRGIVIGCMGLGCDYIYGEVEFIYLKSKWSQLWSTHIFIEFLAYDCLEILATKLLISSSNATLHIAKIPLILRHFLRSWNPRWKSGSTYQRLLYGPRFESHIASKSFFVDRSNVFPLPFSWSRYFWIVQDRSGRLLQRRMSLQLPTFVRCLDRIYPYTDSRYPWTAPFTGRRDARL